MSKYSELFITTTDTLIGIGAPISEKNLNLIYEIKKRKKSKKIIIAISNISQLKKLEDLNDIHMNYINEYWPGATTLIINGNSYRMPNQKQLLELIENIGPIYLTSANISNEANVLDIEEAKRIFPMIQKIYNFNKGSNKASRIIDTLDGKVIR